MYNKQFRRALAELAVFHAVGETERITIAAEALEMPQPSVSRSISRLSDILGIRLLVRSGRGVRLTEAGRTLLPYLDRGLAEIEAGLDQIRERPTHAAGTLRLAFQNSLGEDAVPRAIRRYSAMQPGIDYRLSQGTRSSCINSVADRTADVALVSAFENLDPSLNSVRLWNEPVVLVTPTRHKILEEPKISVSMLRDETFVMLSRESSLRAIVVELCHEAGFEPKIAYEIDDAHTIRGLVAAGLGISILPYSAILTPGIAETGLSDPAAFRHVDAVWAGPKPTRLAAGFIDVLRQDPKAVSPQSR